MICSVECQCELFYSGWISSLSCLIFFYSVYVGLLYNEISLTSTGGSVSLWCVSSHVVVFDRSVRLPWFPMLMHRLL